MMHEAKIIILIHPTLIQTYIWFKFKTNNLIHQKLAHYNGLFRQSLNWTDTRNGTGRILH